MTNKTNRGLIATAGLAVSLATMPAQSVASTLQISVFNPGKQAIFPVTSTIIYGPHEALLVDAQFQKQYAAELVERIRATGRTLKYIYISHSDPDFYFGLSEVKKAFPGARVISTAQTAYLISATQDTKLQVWKDQLGTDAPADLSVPEALSTDELDIDGEKVVIKHNNNDAAHSYLWLPASRTIIGNISVSAGQHLWMADTAGPGAIDAWLQIIDNMKHLAPVRVIAGHTLSADDSPDQLNFVHDYLTAYRKAVSTAVTSSRIVAAMTERFPDLPGRDTLKFGAQAFCGEKDWHVARPYPPVGKSAVVDFGGAAFRLHFIDNKTMLFEDTSGAFQGVKDTVQYTAVEVGENIFMVYWHEPSTGSNVVHVQNWNTAAVYTNIAAKDGSFTHLKGVIKIE